MSSIRFGKIICKVIRAAQRSCRSAVPLLALAGCTWNHHVEVTDTGTPRYERIDIVYELSGAHGALEHSRMRTVSASANEDGTDLGELAAAEPAWMSARLAIEFPHPDGHADVARATLQLSQHLPLAPEPTTRFDRFGRAVERWITSRQQPAPAPRFPRDEVWSLDIPKHQLDLLLTDLAGCGLFDTQRRPNGGSHVAIRIDRGELEKPWTPEPRLDDFVTRVYREGRFEGFADPIVE